MSKLRVGMVGCGGIGRGPHMRGWKEVAAQCEVVACCDVDPQKVEGFAKEHNVPGKYTDYREMLAKEKLDIVDNCTPNAFHHPVSAAASKAGCHVICEKPFAIAPKQVGEMIAAAKKAKKLLMCAQSMRFSGSAQTFKKVLDRGVLGKVYYVRAQAIRRRYLPGAPTFIQKSLSGGGPLLDIGVHVLDFSYWCMGAPKPIAVSAMAGTFMAKRDDVLGMWGQWDPKKYDVEDFAVGLIRFENGAALTLECSFLLNMKDRERFTAQFFGDRAGASYPEMEIYGERDRVIYDEKIAYAPEMSGHVEEIRSFVDSIVRGKPAAVPPEQSLQVIKMLDGLYRSAALGAEVKLR